MAYICLSFLRGLVPDWVRITPISGYYAGTPGKYIELPNNDFHRARLLMVATVYIESSVISYLTSRPSRDLIIAARQAITAEWWEEQKSNYKVYVSALVEEEISRGDSRAAKLRLSVVEEVPALDISEEAKNLAKALIRFEAIPANSEEDALHIGIAAANGIDYLLTWNFKHINNAEAKAAIVKVVEKHGLVCPVFCSPEELGA